MDKVTDKYINDMLSTRPQTFSGTNNIIIASLGLLFEHEFAHLDLNSPYYRELERLSNARGSGAIGESEYNEGRRLARLSEERRADQIALAKTQQLIESQMPTDEKGNTDAVELYEKFSLIGMSSVFKDRTLFNGMDGFRGMRSEDLVFEFSHNGCDEDRASGKFNDPDLIKVARERPLPAMTKSEFEHAEESLLPEKQGQQVYDHYFVRANYFEDAMRAARRGDVFSFLDQSDELDLIDALVHSDPERARGKARRALFPVLEGAAPMSELVNSASILGDFELAVTCPLEQCYVGHLHNDMGYIELVGNDDKLSEVRWMYKIAGYSEADYLRNMVDMTAFFLRVGGTDVLASMAEVRAPTFKCGAASAFVQTNTRVYHSTSVNREGWVYIRIFSPKMFDALDGSGEESGQSHTPSFSCDGNVYADEVKICADEVLSALDTKMANEYKNALSIKKGTPVGVGIVKSQRIWLASRHACGSDAACLKQLYNERIASLREIR